MSEKFLKNKDTGFIYDWNKYLAEEPNMVEVSEEEAYPERFVPEQQRARKSKVELETKDIPELPEIVFPELNAEASKGIK
jgi:hypothetical protein